MIKGTFVYCINSGYHAGRIVIMHKQNLALTSESEADDENRGDKTRPTRHSRRNPKKPLPFDQIADAKNEQSKRLRLLSNAPTMAKQLSSKHR